MPKAKCTAAAAVRAAATIPPGAAVAAAARRAAAVAKPRIAITEGDPSGIGPEIARSAAADARVLKVCEPVLYGADSPARFEPGRLSAEGGQAAYDAIVRAATDARRGEV